VGEEEIKKKQKNNNSTAIPKTLVRHLIINTVNKGRKQLVETKAVLVVLASKEPVSRKDKQLKTPPPILRG
jgi:hypothetical protein